MRSSDSSSPEAAAIIVAGGSGRRVGGAPGALAKQYREIDGQPMLLRAIRPFVEHPGIRSVLVVIPAADLADPPEWLRGQPVTLVAGGEQRSDSVWNGIQALPQDAGVVLIHDGARPFVSREVIDRVLEHAASTGVVPAIPATDTIKESDDAGFVSRTADRSRLWHAQTPQGFPRQALEEACGRARRHGWQVTDDASAVERAGFPVRLVRGAPENLKVTSSLDLELADLLARGLRRV